MHTRRSRLSDTDINPYIALADMCINLVLILTFVLAATTVIGRSGWEQVRYRDYQQAFRIALEKSFQPRLLPKEHLGKLDPPGVQRWVFRGRLLFRPGSAQLTEQGREAIIQFAKVLSRHRDKWRRIRVEGHTMPPRVWHRDDWELSCQRAAIVARLCVVHGHIPPHFLTASGRAGQDPWDKRNPDNPENERVEIAIEYAAKPADSSLRRQSGVRGVE